VATVGALIWLVVPTLGARTAIFAPADIAPGVPEWAEGVNLSGRLIIWHDVWSSMVAWGEPWGRGLGSTAAFLASRYETIRHVHNEFLRLLAEIGPPGLALFLLG
jgi:O-antigen ligase